MSDPQRDGRPGVWDAPYDPGTWDWPAFAAARDRFYAHLRALPPLPEKTGRRYVPQAADRGESVRPE